MGGRPSAFTSNHSSGDFTSRLGVGVEGLTGRLAFVQHSSSRRKTPYTRKSVGSLETTLSPSLLQNLPANSLFVQTLSCCGERISKRSHGNISHPFPCYSPPFPNKRVFMSDVLRPRELWAESDHVFPLGSWLSRQPSGRNSPCGKGRFLLPHALLCPEVCPEVPSTLPG